MKRSRAGAGLSRTELGHLWADLGCTPVTWNRLEILMVATSRDSDSVSLGGGSVF